LLDIQSIRTALQHSKVKFGEVKHDLEMAAGLKPQYLPFTQVAKKASNSRSLLTDVESQQQNINLLFRATYALEAVSDMREAMGYSKIEYQNIGTGPVAEAFNMVLDFAEHSLADGLNTIKEMLEGIQQIEHISAQTQHGIIQTLNLLTCCLMNLQTPSFEVRISRYQDVIKAIENLTDKLSKSEGTIFAERELHSVRKLIHASSRLLYTDYKSYLDHQVDSMLAAKKAAKIIQSKLSSH